MSRTRFQEVTVMPAPGAHISFRERTGSLRAALMLLLLVAATAATSPAQTFTTLHNFCSKKNPAGYCLDGNDPLAPLVQGTNGDLYGTTEGGGTNGYGTVFKVTPAGKLTTIYNFCSQASCTDGSTPEGGLVLATDGSFYGTTQTGGTYNDGTVFKITAAGKLTPLHSFDGTDGESPEAALIQATNENFYGTTLQGGAYGGGAAFEITASGTLTTLHSFCAALPCGDGYEPNGLIQAADGNFYGTTLEGGDYNCPPYAGNNGTFFQLSPSGTLTTLAGFCLPDGIHPNSTLVQAADGNFYGTTMNGGGASNPNYGGAVYEMTPTGSATWLYSFCLQTGCPDGNDPAGLILGTDGNFYGTTGYGGGNNNAGTVFEITSTGQLTTLHSFNGTDGGYYGAYLTNGALLLDTNGTFYGITYQGGKNYNAGTIYSLATGLGPFVETIPTSGKAKTKVTILGTNLTGATAVRFNGTAATFKVISASKITTTVPAAATSGTVTVTTSGGATLNSNVTFQVP
jgi:uncharacterized repeat protein (TIGR03803 family)